MRGLPLALALAAVLAACPSTRSPDTAPGIETDTDADTDRDADTMAECNAAVGRTAPLAVCNASEPCTAVSGGGTITEPTVAFACSGGGGDRPSYDDGAPLTWTDTDEVERATCVFTPPAASLTPLPLVLFFHGAGGAATDVYDYTSLRTKAETTSLGVGTGFVLASVAGRNLHWPTADPRDGPHHDIYHRDFGSPSENPDIANADRIIDQLAASGTIDTDRIYMMGWSNGGFFAQEYGIARHEAPTPGGNRVAAVAAYSAADPFHTTRDDAVPSCRLDPYPTSDVPITLTTRACDIVACDADQAASFVADGYPVAPGFVVEPWIDDLATRVSATEVEWHILKGNGDETTSCTAPGFCLWAGALLNHVRWPDGIADNSDIDHEGVMLEFLAAHPL